MAKLPKGGLSRFVAWVNGEEVVDDLKHGHHQKKKTKAKHLPHLTMEQRLLGYRILGVLICSIFVLILLATVSKLPTFGSPNNPASNEVVERYIESGIEETGAINLVAGMILDYRAFDTFGESNVLFLAVISVVMLLKRDRNNFDEDDEKILNEDMDLDDEDDNIILKRFTMIIFPLITLYGVYVILNGHLSP
ncbi:hydrogen gas-evolving membrane-bound hydrogenase subunit E, partial [Dielma fastidiosa]